MKWLKRDREADHSGTKETLTGHSCVKWDGDGLI